MTPPPLNIYSKNGLMFLRVLSLRFSINMITERNTTKVRLFYEILIRFAKNLDFWP